MVGMSILFLAAGKESQNKRIKDKGKKAYYIQTVGVYLGVYLNN